MDEVQNIYKTNDFQKAIDSPVADRLMKFIFDEDGNRRNNIAGDFDNEILEEIGSRVSEEYGIDKASREDWERQLEDIFVLAKQTSDKKYIGGQLASNVKYPILATAAIQFHARAYPNIVMGSNVVKCQVIGSDVTGEKAQKGKRISQHMSYQILEQMDGWEDEMDQLLISLSLVGTAFKKTFYDTVEKKNVSELVFAEDFVVNYNTTTLAKARRATHVIELYKNDIVERINTGAFLDIDIDKLTAGRKDSDNDDQSDRDLPYTFLEQHRFWDLDGDGYEEPYVITIERESTQVVRIIPRYDPEGVLIDRDGNLMRIIPVQYFTQFTFLPAFDGGFYRMGFGALLYAPVHIINTIFNQLLDAGRLANCQGGFLGQGIRLRKSGGSGEITFQQGEWKQISLLGDDIRKSVLALPVREPSNVLFQLLALMLEGTKQLASQTEVLAGEQPTANQPATTTLALIEQGLKVFTGIYKRVYRSLKYEFKKLRRLNKMFLSDAEYNAIIDQTRMVQTPDGQMQLVPVRALAKEDYGDLSMDVIPISGSADVSDTQRTIKAQALMELRGQGMNDDAINRRYLEALQIPDINELIPPQGTNPPPDPKFVIEQKKLELQAMQIEIEARRQMAEEREKNGKIMKYWADSIKALAEAEAQEAGTQLELYKNELKHIADSQKAYAQIVGQLASNRNQV